MMDINRYVTMNVAKDNNQTTAVVYNRQSGMRESAYEHRIPEKLFTNPADPNRPQAISAVKALALAASQGQKIFTLTQANKASWPALLGQITIDPQAMVEIQNALAAGKEVTVHQSPIAQSGWTGSGYIIIDPGTGTGAYKIVGDANGGALYGLLFFGIVLALAAFLIFDGLLLMWGALFLAEASVNFWAGLFLVIWESTAALQFINDAWLASPGQLNKLAAATVITEIVGLLPEEEIGGYFMQYGELFVGALKYGFLLLWAEMKMYLL